VSGHELDVRLMGVSTFVKPCSEKQQEALYEKCVVDEALALGWDVSHPHRQLELRGSRELMSCPAYCCAEPLEANDPCVDNGCYSCWPKGHYCFTWCHPDRFERRLQVSDEDVHTERFLLSVGALEQAANKCLDHASMHGSPCLGNPEDITIKLYIHE
jgi:hypothetical protein